jgi:hypothetical protein
MEKTGRGRGRMLFDDLWSFLRKILFWLRRPKCKCNSALSHTKNDGNTLNYVSHLKHFVHKSFNNYNHLRLGVSTLYLDLNQESLDTNWECLNINQESLNMSHVLRCSESKVSQKLLSSSLDKSWLVLTICIAFNSL